ncbi:MAG: glycolate oxidase subunit GlcF [Rhodospirillaceae bacterium]
MDTQFTEAQLADPRISQANDILRSCVHCGFCNATCPTYLLTGDERDGPRGRIYMIRDILQQNRAATSSEAHHLDRCLSCFSCVSTCPASVDYRRLIDPMRERLLRSFSPPLSGNIFRRLIGEVLTLPRLSGLLILISQPFKSVLQLAPGPFGRLFKSLPATKPSMPMAEGLYKAMGHRKFRVILNPGCIQQTVAPQINKSTISLLTRLGVEVVVPKGGVCCGSLHHHLGLSKKPINLARRNLGAWEAAEASYGPIDAIISNASGCGVMTKDYGELLKEDESCLAVVERYAEKAIDICSFLYEADLKLEVIAKPSSKVAFHMPCSLLHGQGVAAAEAGPELLRRVGFEVVRPKEEHICCGSAGTYSMMQGIMSDALKQRKLDALRDLEADVVVSANIGCLTQLDGGLAVPTVHVVELLDWATGGTMSNRLAGSLPGGVNG